MKRETNSKGKIGVQMKDPGKFFHLKVNNAADRDLSLIWKLGLHWYWIKYQRQSFEWNRKVELYCFARPREPRWVPGPQNLCPNLGGFGEEFYSDGSRAALPIRLRCVQHLHSFNLASGCLLILMTFFVSLIWPQLVFSGVKNASTCWGLQFCNSSKVLLCVSLKVESGPARSLHSCFLTAPPLSLHPLPALISSPSGRSHGRSWNLFLIRNGGHGKASLPRSPTGCRLFSPWTFSFMEPHGLPSYFRSETHTLKWENIKRSKGWKLWISKHGKCETRGRQKI